jgi:hypothetical protein
MSTKHTPGPWELENGLRVYAPGKGGPLLATVAYLPRAKGQDAANARLMAAAPDMLAALQDAVYRLAQLGLDTEPQRAAIAKATS